MTALKPEDVGLDVTVEVITPAEAQAYLDNNAKHRPIKERKVAEYMMEMEDGTWALNGKTICFDWNGREWEEGVGRLHRYCWKCTFHKCKY